MCQKSIVISKNACSNVKISQQATELDICIQKYQEVSSSDKESAKNIESDGAIDRQQLLDGECNQFHKQTSSLVDSAATGRQEGTGDNCQSNYVTIFSSILESIEFYGGLDIQSDAGSKKDLKVPQLGADESDGNIRTSSDYQTCNISDFSISDMVLAGFPFDDISETSSCYDFKCTEPSMLFDVAERYTILPLLEDNKETSSTHNAKAFEEATSNDSSLYLAIHQIRSSSQDSDTDHFSELNQSDCFDPHMFIRNLPDLSDVRPDLRGTRLANETWKKKNVTLVLDLDETLVHSTLEHCDDADFTFSVFFNMKDHSVYVKQRPFLKMFLERVAEIFEVAIFTASERIYAEQLLDILDPEGKLISRRAYRESCTFSNGSYTKDLTVLGIDLAKVAIVDNCPQVFRLQVNNGIPIKSWFDDPSDHALISLLPFLETLAEADDVRPIIAKKFGNDE